MLKAPRTSSRGRPSPSLPAHHLTDGLWLTRGRISDMTSVATIGTPPASSFDDAARVEVRLTLLHPEPAQPPMLDGAWWPRSSSLSDELPGLITELRHRDLPITRVTYNPELWDRAPRRLRVDGRVIRLGWFRSIDRHLLCLTGGYGDDRLELLVVPPETSAAVAARAMTLAAGRGNRSTATDTLRAARIPPGVGAGVASAVPRPRPAAPETDPTDAWESEGGHLHQR